MIDMIIIGGGPAGLSAAITARQRNNGATIITNDMSASALYKAHIVGNYPGLPDISGKELLNRLTTHATDAGAELIIGKVSSAMHAGDSFHIGYGADILTSRSVILATGITQTSFFPGEEALLGRGVSYCATCDGMLYRGERVCVVCLAAEAAEEAEYLASIGCEVIRLETRNIKINGEEQVTSVTADNEDIQCAGVFILRQAVAPHLLFQGLETEGGHVRAGQSAETNIPGLFAAGDCVGKPYQIAKAAGQGQVAALSASAFINEN